MFLWWWTPSSDGISIVASIVNLCVWRSRCNDIVAIPGGTASMSQAANVTGNRLLSEDEPDTVGFPGTAYAQCHCESVSGYFLPIGLLLALLVAVLAPTPGALLHQAGLVPWMVVIIFLVNGYQVDLKRLPRAGAAARASLVAVVISLLLGPLLGLATVSLFESEGSSTSSLVRNIASRHMSRRIGLAVVDMKPSLKSR